MTTATLPVAKAAAHDPYYVYRPLLDLIGFGIAGGLVVLVIVGLSTID